MTVNRPECRAVTDAGRDPPLFKGSGPAPSSPTMRDTDFPTSSVLVCFRMAERRWPLAASRAVLFAQLVDAPSAWPDRFRAPPATAKWLSFMKDGRISPLRPNYCRTDWV